MVYQMCTTEMNKVIQITVYPVTLILVVLNLNTRWCYNTDDSLHDLIIHFTFALELILHRDPEELLNLHQCSREVS